MARIDLKILCAFAFLTAPAQAQVFPEQLDRSQGQVVDDVRPEQPNAERAPREILAPPETPGPALSAAADEVTVDVSEIVVEGAEEIDPTGLEVLWADLIGRPATLREVSDLGRRIQAYVRGEGFIFSRVSPPSTVTEGRLVYTVQETLIEAVTVEESADPVGAVMALLTDMAKRLEGLNNPHVEDLERVLLLMRDTPGVTRATAVPRAAASGSEAAIDLVINVERKPFSGALFADNRQSPVLGDGLVGGVLAVNSFGSGGDTLIVTGLNSFWTDADDLTERHLGQVEYKRFIGSSGLLGSLRALYSIGEPGEDLEPIVLRSKQLEVEIALEYPVVRTRDASIWVGALAEWRESRTTAAGALISDDDLRVVGISARGLSRDEFGYFEGEIGIRQGLGFFGASDSGDDFISRPDGDPQATVVYAELAREHFFSDAFSVFLSAGGQISSGALLSSEEFAVGGLNYGRGYDPSEVLGDDGFGLSAELRFDLDVRDVVPEETFGGADAGSLQFYGFGDYAKISDRQFGSEDIGSVGGGVRFNLPLATQVSFEVAKPLSELDRTDSDDVRFFFGLQKLF